MSRLFFVSIVARPADVIMKTASNRGPLRPKKQSGRRVRVGHSVAYGLHPGSHARAEPIGGAKARLAQVFDIVKSGETAHELAFRLPGTEMSDLKNRARVFLDFAIDSVVEGLSDPECYSEADHAIACLHRIFQREANEHVLRAKFTMLIMIGVFETKFAKI